ncbi:cytoskeleton-associated protein 2-like [Pterocles gutturalis]
MIPWSFNRKQLEEWLASKGKTYKRPPMTLLQKNPVKLSCRNVKEKEKREKPEQLSLEKINNILTECLKLVEEVGMGKEPLDQAALLLEQVSRRRSSLQRCPRAPAEKFAKFWICKAKLLTWSGPFDVVELYKAAVCAGAMPIEELRAVVLDIWKAANIRRGRGRAAPSPGAHNAVPEREPAHGGRATRSRQQALGACAPPQDLPKGSCPPRRGKELLEGPELKFLTPVRRSLRIERVGSRYPEMLKDHDPVVLSLSEILDAEEETRWGWRIIGLFVL